MIDDAEGQTGEDEWMNEWTDGRDWWLINKRTRRWLIDDDVSVLLRLYQVTRLKNDNEGGDERKHK